MINTEIKSVNCRRSVQNVAYCFSVTSNSTAGFKRRSNSHPFHLLSLRLSSQFPRRTQGATIFVLEGINQWERLYECAIECTNQRSFVPESFSFRRHIGEDPGDEVEGCFPLLGLTPSGLFMGLSSTLIYTSELILWFHYLCSQCYAAQHSYVPLLSIRRDLPS